MSAETMTVAWGVLRRWFMPAVLVSLVAGLGSLVPASQAALAASQGVASISAGGDHTCAVISGNGYCWGENYNGELGDGTHINSGFPAAVDTSGVLAGKTLTQISAGYEHTCALDAAGAAYCWGLNSYGQLGDASTSSTSAPVAVDVSGVLAGKTLIQITAGIADTCALDAAGAAYCWGDNSYGQLGDGSTTGSSVPVAVDTSGVLAGKTLTQITPDHEHTCALDATAGTVYCWGGNSYSQLGDGSTTGSSVPVAVDTSGVLAGQAITQIAVGWYDTCALDATAGTVYCWGRNSYGQLGDGSTTDSSVPVAVDTGGVLAGKPLTQITIGAYDMCAIDASGAAYCWGDNHFGELGDGSTTDSSVPVAVDTGGVLAGQALTQITAGVWHTCSVAANGGVYCWGRGASGELGDGGTGIPSSVPVLVGL